MRRFAHRRIATPEGGLGAASFPGVADNYLGRASSAALQGGAGISVGARLELAAKGQIRVAVGKWDGGTLGNREYALGYSSFSDRFEFMVTSPFNDQYAVAANALGSPSLGGRYFVVGWFNGSNQIGIRVSGAGATTTAAAGFGMRSGGTAFRIGGDTNQTQMWEGVVDEAFVASVALSDAEIDALSGLGYGQLSAGQKTPLVGWWPLNEDTGVTTWKDAHSTLDLTAVGTITSVGGIR